MNATSKCPSSRELRELLEASAADSDQTGVVAHLDACVGCQQALEALANDDGALTKYS